jgi:hypothetical protein
METRLMHRILAAIALFICVAPACAIGLADAENALRQDPLGTASSIVQTVFGALK